MGRYSAGFLALGLMVAIHGCGSDDGYRELGDVDDVVNTDPVHDHHHAEGPHGGHILEFGDYHGEIVYSDGLVSVYILGDDAETAVPLEAATSTLMLGEGDDVTVIELAANPLEGEAEGTTSRFTSAEGALPESVDDIEEITGQVEVKAGDKSMTAKVTHDHDHDHAH
ncbi:hypothetical protein AB1L42_21000 [Thalassoglobus sp. JC818]|uniref:hypothetical protein n=1 Tax=Thalassoglobus sp. JC818 TaxID=3232136 RepID=UPI0034579D99